MEAHVAADVPRARAPRSRLLTSAGTSHGPGATVSKRYGAWIRWRRRVSREAATAATAKSNETAAGTRAGLREPRSAEPMTAPKERSDISDQRELTDSAEPAASADPIDSREAADPMLPTERTDPTLPIDKTEPCDPMHSKESCDHSDHLELDAETSTTPASSTAGCPYLTPSNTLSNFQLPVSRKLSRPAHPAARHAVTRLGVTRPNAPYRCSS